MEAQERSKPILLCQKCFSLIPNGEDYCPECGAPVVDDLTEGSDTAVYPELARANLWRMRGEYKQAEDICLAVLRRHPNSATANTLLGDICAERGDLKQAAEWYEMALDITPDSVSDRQKLESVRSRIRDHETAQTAKTLGLPESRPKIGLWVGGAVGFIALIAVVAFLLGERTNARKSTGSAEVLAPVTIPLDSSRDSAANADPEPSANPDPAAPDLWSRLRIATGADGARLVSAGRLAEGSELVMVFTVSGTEDPRGYAAELGRLGLGEVTDAPAAMLIGLRNGKMAYSGTMSRSRLEAASTAEWKSANGDDAKAFQNATLENEWPAAAPAEPPPATPSGEGGP